MRAPKILNDGGEGGVIEPHSFEAERFRTVGMQVGGEVERRIGWWSKDILGRWRTWASLKRRFHWGFERALSKRFTTKPLSLLFVQVK